MQKCMSWQHPKVGRGREEAEEQRPEDFNLLRAQGSPSNLSLTLDYYEDWLCWDCEFLKSLASSMCPVCLYVTVNFVLNVESVESQSLLLGTCVLLYESVCTLRVHGECRRGCKEPFSLSVGSPVNPWPVAICRWEPCFPSLCFCFLHCPPSPLSLVILLSCPRSWLSASWFHPVSL